jgi:WD40 repeat protein
LKKSTTAIRRIAWNDDSSKPRFVTGDYSGILYVWNISDKTATQFKFHNDEIKGLAWIDADTFASCSMDGKIKIGRIGSDNYLQKFRHSVKCSHL